jgi:hypothetical protein
VDCQQRDFKNRRRSAHDYGCSLKAYRRDVIQDVKLYGEMHRFIPIYASWVGARVTEIPLIITPARWENRNTESHGRSKSFSI